MNSEADGEMPLSALLLQPWQVIDLVRSFVAGRAPDTHLECRQDLNSWFAFCIEFAVDVLRAQERHVHAYIQDQIETGPPDPLVVERRLGVLRDFYDHALAHGAVADNPVP